MSYGGFNNWQFAQVFAVICLLMCVLFAVRLVRKPKSQRAWSRSAMLLGGFAVATIANTVWYAVDSKPYWDARARLNESYDILDQVIDVEMVDANRYGPITVLNSWRPRTWPPNCIRGRLHGIGHARFAEPLTNEHYEELARHFEGKGFTVRRSHVEGTSRFAVSAVRGNESYLYSFNSLDRPHSVVSDVDVLCLEDIGLDGDDCINCIESFLTES